MLVPSVAGLIYSIMDVDYGHHPTDVNNARYSLKIILYKWSVTAKSMKLALCVNLIPLTTLHQEGIEVVIVQQMNKEVKHVPQHILMLILIFLYET